MIEIEKLQFRYPRSDFHLQIAALKIEAAEKVAVVGPSGSGKTTLLNLIAGIVTPDSGTIRVGDQTVAGSNGSMNDAQRRDFRAANIGMVFQQFELVEYLNVLDNILLPFAINESLDREHRSQQGRAEQARELAQSVGLDSKLRRRPHQLSQGEQQRVAICRALITNPQLILADEPTGNLDPKNKRLILDLIFSQSAANDQSLIVVTHDRGILDGFDRVIDFENFYIDGTGDSAGDSKADLQSTGEVSS